MSHSRKLPAIIASLALLSFVAILFFPALFQGKILAPLDITTTLLSPWNESDVGAKPHNQSPSDAVTQYLPYRTFAEQSLREDGYIGWNPYEMGGYSLAANTMALPGSWPMQLHRWLPFKDAWNLGIIGEFLIAGIGMLVFLRSRKLPWLPSLIGAIAFMFNAQFIIWIYHRWALGSFCWMPWVLWAYGNGFSTKIFPRRALLLPGFLALALLGGSLQHAAFVFLACSCLAVADFDFRRPLANRTPLIAWIAVFMLALFISAFSLIPQLQGYLSNNATGHIRGGIGYPNGISQILFHILLIPARIWPWLAGDPQSMDAWKLLKSDFMSLNYIGTIPMLLGLAGLFIRGMPRAAKWLIVIGLFIPLTPLVGPLYHRVELLFILGATWMTAEVLAHLAGNNSRSSSPDPTNKVDQKTTAFNLSRRLFLPGRFICPRILAITVLGIGVVLVAATLTPTTLREKFENAVVSKAVAKSDNAQFGADTEWIASRALEWTERFSIVHPKTAWLYGLLVVGTAGLLLSSRNERKSQTLGQLLILGATSLELATLFQTWVTWSDPKDLQRDNQSIEVIRSLAGSNRVLQYSPDTNISEVFAMPNILASYGIPSINAYESIKYRSPLVAAKKQPISTQLSLAGVGIAVHPTDKIPPPGTNTWPTEQLSDRFTLRLNTAVPAPVSAGSGSRPTANDTILIALEKSISIVSTGQTPNRRTIHLPKNLEWIRISQNWHPGWKWRILGQSWQSFINGPDAACWIDPIPPETRKIEVQFFPRPAWLNIVSLTAAVALLGLFMFSLVNRNFRKA